MLQVEIVLKTKQLDAYGRTLQYWDSVTVEYIR